MIFFWTILVLVLLYALLLVGSSAVWTKSSEIQFPDWCRVASVTIVVPFRDESAHLSALLESLSRQDYPHLTIILVNDHSTDDYESILEKYSDVRCCHLSDGATGKKAALTLGVKSSDSEYVLFTDADCTHSADWVSTMMKHLVSRELDWLAGSINYRLEAGFLSFFQVLESAYLVLISGVSIQIQKPTTCNGANIGLKRSVFLESGGYQGLSKTPSGDDELLMQKLHQLGYQLGYCFDPSASVETRFSTQLKEALNQKSRWASKLRYNVLGYNALLAAFVLVFHLSSLFILFLAPLWAILLLGLRLVIESIAMVVMFRFFKRKIKPGYFLVSFLVYPLYVIFMVVKSQFKEFTWKGRKY